VKLRRTAATRIEGALLVVRKGRRVLLLREDQGVARMAGFWGLPAPEDLPAARVGACLGEFRHTITYHHYRLSVFEARVGAGAKGADLRWFDPLQLGGIPLSTTAKKALKLAGTG
jgi:A/G-specific adenine glycosylase